MGPEAVEKTMRKWLSAERRGQEDAAEALLARLFEQLPLASPALDFADRVLAQAGIVARAPQRAPSSRRWAVAAALLVLPAAAAALLFTALLPPLAEWMRPAQLVAGGVQMVLLVGGWIASVASAWEGLAEVGRWARLLATTPEVCAAVALCALVASAAYGALYALMRPTTRSSDYVQG